MPRQGENRTTISLPKALFDMFKEMFEEEEERWRAERVGSPSALITELALQRRDEILQLKATKKQGGKKK